MVKPIGLDGFEHTFGASDDPWSTFSNRDEAVKRAAILHAIGPGPLGRVLELGAGNGSNSVAIAARARRLDATEGTAKGTALTGQALHGSRGARALHLPLPARFPRLRYDVVVVAELLYYLSARDMARVATDVAAALRPGGMLVLAHHRIDFHDFSQHAEHIHDRFLGEAGCAWRPTTQRRTAKWIVQGLRLRDFPGHCVEPNDAALR